MGAVKKKKDIQSMSVNLLDVIQKLEEKATLLVETENPKITELESHFIRLLDALVELEERITSLEKTRELSSEFNNAR